MSTSIINFVIVDNVRLYLMSRRIINKEQDTKNNPGRAEKITQFNQLWTFRQALG